MDIKTQLSNEAKDLALRLYELNKTKEKIESRLKEIEVAFSVFNALESEKEDTDAV